jgi:6-phosphogluconolactonase
MNNVQIFSDKQSLADAVAKQSVELLDLTIQQYGQATWVLAGGTTPELAYQVIANKYLDVIDWSKVTFVIGDERIGSIDSSDNNWQSINNTFLRLIPQATFLRPKSDLSAEQAAADYSKQLHILPQTNTGVPRFDIIWLGMGEDGHTLSLFPNHPDFQPTDQLVIPIHNSPKPPTDRISLTLHALTDAGHTLILASGAGKATAIKNAQQTGSTLPIALAANLTNATWYIDQAAAQ